MIRVGIVGTESSHVDHVLRYCNTEHRAGDARVVAVAGTDRDVGIACHVTEPADLLGRVDAVLVTDRDGRRHAERAMPFLTAGLPTFVDKPFATTVADAELMVGTARRHRAPLTSYSALRFHPVLLGLRHGDPPRAVVATGPADPDSPYAGIHFYGVHPVEAALALAPGPVSDVRVSRLPGLVAATAVVGDTAVTIHCVRPGADPVPFHVQVTSDRTVTATELPLGDDYLYPALDRFFRMVHGGEPPISHDDLLRPVRLLSAMAAGPSRLSRL